MIKLQCPNGAGQPRGEFLKTFLRPVPSALF